MAEGFVGLPDDLPDAKERRRYALLQAAALIFAANGVDKAECLDDAEWLLCEIEKREKEQ